MINITIHRHEYFNKRYLELCDKLVEENVTDFDEVLERVEAIADVLELVEVVNKCILIVAIDMPHFHHTLTIKTEL